MKEELERIMNRLNIIYEGLNPMIEIFGDGSWMVEIDGIDSGRKCRIGGEASGDSIEELEEFIMSDNTPQIVARLFSSSIGKIIELKYKNSMDNIIHRKGRLEKELNWYYLYDEGKSGNQFNIALQEKDFDKIVEIKVL